MYSISQPPKFQVLIDEIVSLKKEMTNLEIKLINVSRSLYHAANTENLDLVISGNKVYRLCKNAFLHRMELEPRGDLVK
jgi:hypothetical protein